MDRADRAAALHDKYLSDRKISRAINILLAAQEFGGFAERHEKMIERFLTTVELQHETNREQNERGKPLFLALWLEIVREDEHWITLWGSVDWSGCGLKLTPTLQLGLSGLCCNRLEWRPMYHVRYARRWRLTSFSRVENGF